MIVSLTRLRLRSARFLPGFAWYTQGNRQSMRKHPGFAGGALLADEHLTFWTVTLWRSEADLKQWRSAGAHGRAMSRLKHWCDEASVARWETDAHGSLPDWPTCYSRMVNGGRLSPVLHPSPAQRAGLAAIARPTARPSSLPIAPVSP